MYGTEQYSATYVMGRGLFMKIRTPMPELTGETYIFNRMKEKQEGKKVTLIYFWSASCQQCEQSVAKLKEMQAIFQNQIAIYTIHMPRTKQDHQLNEVENKIKKLDIPFPVYVDNEFKLTNSFDNRIVPAFYIFDENQQLRFFKAGMITTRLLQQKIQRLIY